MWFSVTLWELLCVNNKIQISYPLFLFYNFPMPCYFLFLWKIWADRVRHISWPQYYLAITLPRESDWPQFFFSKSKNFCENQKRFSLSLAPTMYKLEEMLTHMHMQDFAWMLCDGDHHCLGERALLENWDKPGALELWCILTSSQECEGKTNQTKHFHI